MKFYALSYVVTAVLFLGLDAIWLTLAGPRLYRPQLGDLLPENFNVAPAAAFDPLDVIGILIFAIQPALATGRLADRPALRGAVRFFRLRHL